MTRRSTIERSRGGLTNEGLSPVALAELIEARREALLEEWARRVLADPGLPTAATLSRPALNDHFPQIVDRIVATLRSFETQPEALGRLVGATAEARDHVRDRMAVAYTVPEVLRELSHLRLTMIAVCEDAAADPEAAAILHSALDQLMINTSDELARVALEARQRAETLASERGVLYEREREARHACEEAHRAQDQFLAIISHELRTPLNAISGWAQMLERRDDDVARRARAIATIQRNAEAQAHLIDGLMEIARLRSGLVTVERSVVNIGTLLRSVVGSFTNDAAGKDLRLELLRTSDQATVVGDEQRMRQVFENLIRNAIRFTPEGGMVEVSVEDLGGRLKTVVRDSGVGISAEFLPHVFDPFRQADASWTRRHGGLGIGLAIANGICRLLGGTIEAASAGRGHGASFSVTLPAAPMVTHGSGQAMGPTTGHSNPSWKRLAGLRVVVVDDDDDARSLTTAVLLSEGSDVRDAGSAQEAFELIRQFDPDVLVTDLAMPEEDGLSLLRRVQAEYGYLPSIVLSAFPRSDAVDTVERTACDRRLEKPLKVVELLDAVEALGRPTHDAGKSRFEVRQPT